MGQQTLVHLRCLATNYDHLCYRLHYLRCYCCFYFADIVKMLVFVVERAVGLFISLDLIFIFALALARFIT